MDQIEALLSQSTARQEEIKRDIAALQKELEDEERFALEVRNRTKAMKRSATRHEVHNGADVALIEGSLPSRIERYLKSAGKPKRASEIAKAVNATARRVITTVNRRTDLFERVERGTYGLKGKNATDADQLSRLQQLKEFLRTNGPMKRKELIEKSGIPEGSISGLLNYRQHFHQLADGRWEVVANGT